MSEYETNNSNRSLRRSVAYGQTLLDARKRNNITIAEVAKSINLTPEIVEAIENSDSESLPQPAFVQGYIRNYAKYLGLAEDQLLEDYAKAVPHALEAKLSSLTNVKTETNSRTPAVRVISILLVIFGLAVFIYGVFDYYRKKADSIEDKNQTTLTDDSTTGEYVLPAEKLLPQEASEPAASLVASNMNNDIKISTLNPMMQNEAVNTADVDVNEQSSFQDRANDSGNSDDIIEQKKAAEAASSANEIQEDLAQKSNEIALAQAQSVAIGEDVIKLTTSSASWIEVIDANNAKLYYELMPADLTVSLQGTAPFDIFLGNALAVEVFVNGVEINTVDHIRSNNTARYKVTVQDSQVIFF